MRFLFIYKGEMTIMPGYEDVVVKLNELDFPPKTHDAFRTWSPGVVPGEVCYIINTSPNDGATVVGLADTMPGVLW